MAHSYLQGGRAPRVLAHRGLTTPDMHDSGLVENSLAAIETAVDAGARYVETDCHLTADGRVVLFHDSDLKRVTGDPRRVADVTYDELEEVMQRRGGVITLEDALARFGGTHFNVDVKARAAAAPAGRLVAAHSERVLLTSFSDPFRRAALAAAKLHAPAHVADPASGNQGTPVPAASPGQRGVIRVLSSVWTGAGRGGALRGLDALQLPVKQGPVTVISKRLISIAHARGVEVHAWTINDPEEMLRLVAMGVDGIVTDRADIALEVLGGP